MTRFAWPSTDLPAGVLAALALFALFGMALLALEIIAHPRRGRLAASGLVGLAFTALAVVRPRVPVDAGTSRKPPLAVLLDDTRSLELPFDSRVAQRREAIERVRAVAAGHPIRWFAMGGRALDPIDPDAPGGLSAARGTSDLGAALAELRDRRDVDPLSVVVVTDGRDAPSIGAAPNGTAEPAIFRPGVPVHTVALGEAAPDASVAGVRVNGAAFAHGPFGIEVDVLCHGGLACDAVTVQWRPLPEAGGDAPAPVEAVVDASSGSARVELTALFERPGRHAAVVSLRAQGGDTVPENDARTVVVDVRRERVRMLHVAGRPTNDVRALRRFLNANSSIDLVSFFILRTHDDDPHAPPTELSLIPFPVDELFEEHLPSFDAVVVQDIDAEEYGLARHLRRLARYVEAGGGLVLVGGPHAFAAGGYDRSSLATVLPTALEATRAEHGATFAPRVTQSGAEHPIQRALSRAGGALEELEGTSALGSPVTGAEVLWEHPSAVSRGGAPMPVLAVRDVRAGRVVAMGTDGTWRLGFSEAAATGSGGAYDALWDAVIGWTLHDARFDPPPLAPLDGCVAGAPLRVAAPAEGVDRAEARPAGAAAASARALGISESSGVVTLEPLAEGVHDVTLMRAGRVTARGRFACERSGHEWVDVRPDRERLVALARATSGVAFDEPSAIDERILPRTQMPSSARHERPIVAPWILALAAALALGLHWYERRRFGLR
jgi:uncharacterized membrane protein